MVRLQRRPFARPRLLALRPRLFPRFREKSVPPGLALLLLALAALSSLG